jgi:hypothetical protein
VRWILLPSIVTFLLFGISSCSVPPWEMPCPEGWVMDAEQDCYHPAADDDSADDDTTEPG